MDYFKIFLFFLLLVVIGILNYQRIRKTARRLVDQCTEKQ